MKEFTVGDKVRVRKDLLIDEFYDDGCKFISEMEDTLSKVGKIVRVVDKVGLIRYIVKFDSDNYYCPYCFSKSMLEFVENEYKFRVGDRVRVREDLVVDTFYDDGCKFISDMEYALGEAGKIVRIERNGRYVIKFDCEKFYHGYCYSPSMLEPIKTNKMEIYRKGDKSPYDFINKFWVISGIWAKVVIINNPEVIVIDEDFNIFTARCHRSDVFNPEIGLEICCKKRTMNDLKNEKEIRVKEIASIERTMENLKEDLKKY